MAEIKLTRPTGYRTDSGREYGVEIDGRRSGASRVAKPKFHRSARPTRVAAKALMGLLNGRSTFGRSRLTRHRPHRLIDLLLGLSLLIPAVLWIGSVSLLLATAVFVAVAGLYLAGISRRGRGRERREVAISVSPVDPDRDPGGTQSWKIRWLQGRPLNSRTKWLAIKMVYVLACVLGVIAVFIFTHGVVLAIGLTVMAFFVGGFIELFALRYSDYLDEWKQANPSDNP